MSKWTEIVDGKRVAIQGLLWNSHQVFRKGVAIRIHIALKEALEEANFKIITPDIEFPIKLADLSKRYLWAHVDAMTLDPSQRIFAAMKLTHNKKVFLLRVYLGQGRLIKLSWRPERESMMYMERTFVLSDGSFTLYLDELLEIFRDYWREVESSDVY
jgi:hypothetical protein